MSKIFILGDSHSIFYYYSNLFYHHWLGWCNLPVTMYQFIYQDIPLYNIVELYQPGDTCKINIKNNDIVVFCFGWNDVNKNIYKYAKNNYESSIDEMVKKYILKIIILLKKYNIFPIINCIYPITNNIIENQEEIIKYTKYMNFKLKNECKNKNIPFFDIYDLLSLDDRIKNSILSNDNTHLDVNNIDLRNLLEQKLLNLCKDTYPLINLELKNEKNVTLFITSCGRPSLLKITLESFVKYNTYPIKEVILCEDSGNTSINEFVKDILPYPIIFCYNDERIGQMKTIEKYTPLIKTKYVFHLEDDYEFFDSGFIELSFKIMDTDQNISHVLLEDEQHDFFKVDINNNLCYKVLTNDPNTHLGKYGNNGDGALSIFSWSPSLKKIEIALLRIPYQLWDDEYTIQLEINKRGKYAVITKNIKNGKKGFCTHIGKNYHVQSKFLNTNRIILGRKDFPDKINIRLKDI